MSNYAILRVTKLKGGSLVSSDEHLERTRDTPNADPDKLEMNELLLGEDGELDKLVESRLCERGIWHRKDSVKAIEFLMTATRSFFLNGNGEIDETIVKKWEQRNVEWMREKFGDRVLKLRGHRDERTPHISGYVLPEVNGRLNAKAIIGNRKDLSRLQDEYAEAMSPLGLERGIKGSRATHQDIGRFYGTILRPVTLEIDRSQVPLPSARHLLSSKGKENYREEVIDNVLEQVEEALETLRNQALLTLEETRKRENAERRAAELVQQAERIAKEREAEFHKERQEKENVIQQNIELRAALTGLFGRASTLEREILQLNARMTDIPLIDVMSRLGYYGEQHDDKMVYRARDGRVSMTITENSVYNFQNELICENAIDLVLFMQNVNRGQNFTERQALGWLANNFGEPRAAAAYVVKSEQSVKRELEETRQEREIQWQRSSSRPIRSREPERVPNDRERQPQRQGPSFSR